MEGLAWKLTNAAVLAGAAFVASTAFEYGWKAATGRPVPAEDDEGTALATLVAFAAASAAIAAVAQRYAYKGARKWIAPRLKGSPVTA